MPSSRKWKNRFANPTMMPRGNITDFTARKRSTESGVWMPAITNFWRILST